MKDNRVSLNADETPHAPFYRRVWFWCVVAVVILGVAVNLKPYLERDRTLRWQPYTYQEEITYQDTSYLLCRAATQDGKLETLVFAPLSETRSAADVEEEGAVNEDAGDWVLDKVPSDARWAAAQERFLYGDGKKLYSCTPEGEDKQLLWTVPDGSDEVHCTAFSGDYAVLTYGLTATTSFQLYTPQGCAIMNLSTNEVTELHGINLTDAGQTLLAVDGGWLYYYESDMSVIANNGEEAYSTFSISRANAATGEIERLAQWEVLTLEAGWDENPEEIEQKEDPYRPASHSSAYVQNGCLYYTGAEGKLLCLPLDGSGEVKEA